MLPSRLSLSVLSRAFSSLLPALVGTLGMVFSVSALSQSTVDAPPATANSEAYVNFAAPPSACLIQHALSLFEWRCAAQVLPPEGQAFALSIGVIVGDNAVVAIDSGATAIVGETAANDIRQAFPDKKLFVINTQPKPEHVLGNIGFYRAYASQFRSLAGFEGRVIGTLLTKNLMESRCPSCIDNFAKRMGSNVVQGTETVIPGFVLSRRQADLVLLDPSLRHWIYNTYEKLDAEETLLLVSPQENAFWVGSAVQKTMVPDLYEGSAMARLNFLGEISHVTNGASLVLSSHGRLDPIWVKRNLNYFTRLQQDILLEMDAGTTEVEIITKLTDQLAQAVPGLTDKDLEIHQLNIQRVYMETEELMLR